MNRHDRGWRSMQSAEPRRPRWVVVVAHVIVFGFAGAVACGVVMLVGAVIAAFTPGGGHGF